jgi:transcriptional regulator with XRE-family HTH domain
MIKDNNDAIIRIGENIRRVRKKSGITQEALAARAGIFCTYLSRIESGQANPTLLVFVALAIALNVKPGELLQ